MKSAIDTQRRSGLRLLIDSYALRRITAIASASAAVVPMVISVLLLGRQMMGYPFALAILLVFGLCLSLLAGLAYLRNSAQTQTTTIEYIKQTLIKYRWTVWAMAITGFFLIINHLLVRGLAVGVWDVEGQFFPYQVLVADHARAGRFIYWDPWSNGGLPIFGDPQVGSLSPLNVAIGLITGGTSYGFILYWLMTWWLGGIGILMLARHFGAPSWGGAVVAMGFYFSGFYTGNAQHTSLVTGLSFLPLVIWRLDLAICSRRLWPAVEAGAIWGLSALAGYPGMTIITGCYAGLWAAGRWLTGHRPGDERHSRSISPGIEHYPRLPARVVMMSLALLTVAALLVLSPTYFAFFFEGAGTHTRTGPLSREIAVFANALDPGALSTIASPYLPILKAKDQLRGINSIWPYTDLSMCSIYCGAIISAGAVLALVNLPRDRWRWWLALLAATTLACALSQTLPLRGWLYDWVYPMRFFRHAAIFRGYFLFTAAVLALFAMRDLAEAIRTSPSQAWWRFLVTSVAVACFAIIIFLIYGRSLPGALSPLSIIHAAGVWLGSCAAAFAVWLMADRFRPLYVPFLLLSLAVGDAFLTGTISKQTMISTADRSLKRWASLDQNHSSNLDLTGNGLLREEGRCQRQPGQPEPDENTIWPTCYSSDQLITKVPVFNSYATTTNSLHLRMANNPTLKSMATGKDRIWFSKEVSRVPVTESSFDAFVSRTGDLGIAPLVIHSPQDLLSPPPDVEATDAGGAQTAEIARLPAAEMVAVEVLRYLPEELVFNVNCESDGWLLVTDRWARSWQAEINGEGAPVYGGNFIFRAVQVRAGRNNVRFFYDPRGFPFLLIISWGTLAVIALWSFYSGLRGRVIERKMRVG
ncbi:MAG TPA: hypothetical protein VFQ92_08230 [Blastocatellia bacterium]|nr:hypothetical protein [Blastocatellia bacterium]